MKYLKQATNFNAEREKALSHYHTQLPHCHTAIAYFLNCRATHTIVSYPTRLSPFLYLSFCDDHISYHIICSDFYLHHPLYADFAHSYIYCFLYVLCIYADLYHPDPSYVLIFYLHHILYADLAHPYIYCFLYVLCIYADLYHPDPSYVQIFYLHHPLYGIQSMPTWLTHTSITFLISICIYADLDHPDPFMCLDFLPSLVITHCMPTWLTHTSITFLIFMYLC